MADADEIARRALELATSYLEADSRKLAEMAGGDVDLLRDAARIVRRHQNDADRTAALSAEHLAFTLITAAYDSLRVKPKAATRFPRKPADSPDEAGSG